MTAKALAGELEVSVRTIYRDVESPHAARIPLYDVGSVVAAARLKLMAAPPARPRDRAGRISGRFPPGRTRLVPRPGRDAASGRSGRCGMERARRAGALPPFDVAGHWKSYLDQFQARRHGGAAVVRLSQGAVERLPDNLPAAGVRAVEVLAPGDLRRRMIDTVEAFAGLYGRSAGPSQASLSRRR